MASMRFQRRKHAAPAAQPRTAVQAVLGEMLRGGRRTSPRKGTLMLNKGVEKWVLQGDEALQRHRPGRQYQRVRCKRGTLTLPAGPQAKWRHR